MCLRKLWDSAANGLVKAHRCGKPAKFQFVGQVPIILTSLLKTGQLNIFVKTLLSLPSGTGITSL